ncbi:shikimate kinase [Metallumcola ferriviriculae]|uniref:Shikimate kinase n=1 Tax=Metallumcola ferriviriculae TaxID=3039180 RepID=A0AAU0URI7_9FIRM|nr:shikimate kinase [Desulfitibacteraceae bacterium MK1]
MANLVLIGFMGSGKTTIGFRLARALKRKFIDTDSEIERLTGLTITRIFIKHGERRFRSEEELMVQKVVAGGNAIIATGGGVVLNPDNVRRLKENGIVIWLKADSREVANRIGRSRNRPMLRPRPDLDKIRQMLAAREKYYRDAADMVIDTKDKNHDQIVAEILKQIEVRQ